MTDLWIFLLGFMITVVTVTAVLVVARSEARDPALNRTGNAADRTRDTLPKSRSAAWTPTND